MLCVQLPAEQRCVGGGGGIQHARHRADFVQKFASELLLALRRQVRVRESQNRERDSVFAHSRIQCDQAAKAAHKEKRSHQQDQRDRDLARPPSRAAGRTVHGCPSLPGPQFSSRSPDRRAMERSAGAVPNTMQVRAATEAENRSTRQSIPVARLTALFPVESNHTRTRLSACPRATPSATPPHAEHCALGERMPKQASSRCSQRHTHRDFAFASAGPRQHQVRQVGAGDQQHQAGDDQQ